MKLLLKPFIRLGFELFPIKLSICKLWFTISIRFFHNITRTNMLYLMCKRIQVLTYQTLTLTILDCIATFYSTAL